ncbi:regulator of G-protein signaling 9-binding protein-like isoform X1 [Empidonax traillii]|uniref:regulator of G-protein signaling 9-binding protein-like isoform X1 n=1 Tax=Empidonax traillii TaxID=164674 RepID=UPI000FFCF966|nr:regulator of G-protein signaling 9-binding protein-like isoform X1 [Empidonax traillii]
MAPGRRDGCRGRGMVGTCAAAQAALCKAVAGHRQLVLQLGGSGDSPRLREERRRRSTEARELSTGKEGAATLGSRHRAPLDPQQGHGGALVLPWLSVPCPAGLRRVLLAGVRQAPVSPRERRELERLWVLFLSALELFLQDLRRAHHLCQLFSVQEGGVAPLRTGMGGWGLPGRRGGSHTQPPAAQGLEEEIEQVRAMLAEMESGANIPPWTVEATETTQPAGIGGTAARGAWAGPWTGHCCGVL